ncbi:hypothetical protein [Gorillibacterium massiliense]|uniref:hypothetical protein n=1 Tax=Gorillibacterium massiliense TaxID=1280390 RepID=UPI0004AF74DA|nr:hypothetical protein [Gorillibacterium massiliense]
MKKIGTFMVFALLSTYAIWLFLRGPDGLYSTKPFHPEVQIDGRHMPVLQGSYCWKTVQGGECSDQPWANETKSASDLPTETAARGSTMVIKFPRKPDKMTATFENVNLSSTASPVQVPKGTVTLPDKAGDYLITINASWGNGRSSSYLLSVSLE